MSRRDWRIQTLCSRIRGTSPFESSGVSENGIGKGRRGNSTFVSLLRSPVNQKSIRSIIDLSCTSIRGQKNEQKNRTGDPSSYRLGLGWLAIRRSRVSDSENAQTVSATLARSSRGQERNHDSETRAVDEAVVRVLGLSLSFEASSGDEMTATAKTETRVKELASRLVKLLVLVGALGRGRGWVGGSWTSECGPDSGRGRGRG